MRVFMTGANGFIGSNVLDFLLDHTDWEFTCICSWRHKGNPLNVKPQSRVHIVTHDLTGVIPDLGTFDYILNLASESHVDRSIAEPVQFVENNVSSTLQVLEYARKHKPKVFVQFSTDEVYGAAEHTEWDVLLPSNPYSASKAAQEMIAIAYWKTYGLPIVITNSNNIIGKNQDPEKFVPKIVRLIKEGKEVTIHTSNGKPGSRYYNPVENVADALLFIVTHYPFKSIYKDRPTRFNLPGGQQLNNLEMAELIAKQLKKPLKYKLIDVASIRPGYDEFYPKTSGEITNLGWTPPITLKKGLEWLSVE